MKSEYRVLIPTIVPMLVGMLTVALLVNYQARQLSAKQSLVFHDALLEVKKAELVNYTKLARSAISDVVTGSNSTDEMKRERVKQILTTLGYSDDGYFYAYKLNGENIVHPKQPYRVGKNWWNLSDEEGQLIIQNLITKAKQGGGYTEYLWEQPSLGSVGKKLGYAEMLEEWDWMFGTGIYIDDIDNKVAEIDGIFNQQIRSTSMAIIGIASLAVAIVFGSGLILRVKERNLASSRLQLLTKRIMDTQDEERRRVSRELHDGISQRLVAIKYSLEEASHIAGSEQNNTRSLMSVSERYVDETLQEVRRISHDLHPSVLDDLGLMAAVEALVEQFRTRTGMNVSFTKVPFRNLLPTDAKTALFRVTQEALSNIERHSGASSVGITFELKNGWFKLTIEDNGMGFEDGTKNNKNVEFGLGLRNMAERMSYFNGRFNIRTSSNGTTLTASIPRKVIGIQHQQLLNS